MYITRRNFIKIAGISLLSIALSGTEDLLYLARGKDVRIEDFPVQFPEVDDSARFNRAMKFLKSVGGGTLHLSKGTYYIENVTQYSNISIRGMDKESTILKRPNRSRSAPHKNMLVSLGHSLKNVIIENVTFDGNYQNLGYVVNGKRVYDVREIHFEADEERYSIEGITIRDCKFVNGNFASIRVKGVYQHGDVCRNVKTVKVENCIFRNIYGNAIYISGFDITISKNKFYNVDDCCIGLDLSVNTVIEDNVCKYNVNHSGYKYLNGNVGIAGAYYAQIESVVKRNCIVDYLIPIIVDSVNVTTIYSARRVVISENIVSAPSRKSVEGLIRIMGGKSVKLSRNVINAYDNYGIGISVQKSIYATPVFPEDITIENNYINNTERAGVYCTDVSNLIIQENELDNCGKIGELAPNSSIFLYECSDFSVQGNKVNNSKTNSISIDTCTKGVVGKGNKIEGNISIVNSTNVYEDGNFLNRKSNNT